MPFGCIPDLAFGFVGIRTTRRAQSEMTQQAQVEVAKSQAASASETCPRAAQLHLGLLEAPQAVSGRAVEYFTCFMEIFDFTFPTPAILANRFTQNSRNSSRSRATTRST